MDAVFSLIEQNEQVYISKLADWVAVKSISSNERHRSDTIEMMHIAATEVKKLGGTCKLDDLGMQTTLSGQQIPLPPVLIGEIGNDPTKKTICIYGHLDVQPAEVSDGWKSPPFDLERRDDKLYGRGSTDDKGPVLCILHAVAAWQTVTGDLPVNLKFIFEGMEESGSVGLEAYIKREKKSLFKDVDYVCISDNYWLGNVTPCITYGLRGNCYFFVTVQCSNKDLHSGLYGGAINEAMQDLIKLFATLTDNKGNITIAGLSDMVAAVTDEERDLYTDINFDPDLYEADIEHARLRGEGKREVLMNRWRYPCLSIHGFEGAYDGPGGKTVIPGRVTGKFSIRLVPDMQPAEVVAAVRLHLTSKFTELDSPNDMSINTRGPGGRPWLADFNDAHFTAAKQAVKCVYHCEPDLIREGGSIPITLTLQEESEKSVLLLPIGCGDDGAHSQNEKINVSNYINGTKLMASYFHEVSKL